MTAINDNDIIPTIIDAELLRVCGGVEAGTKEAMQASSDCHSGNVPPAVVDAMRGPGDNTTRLDKLIGPIGHPESYGCWELLANYRAGNGAVRNYELKK